MKFNEYLAFLTESKKFDDPTYEEMKKFLKTKLKVYAPDATEDDIEVAIYWYSSDYHSGQNSNLYSSLSKSEYTPGRIENGIEKDSVAYDLYLELESKYGKEEKKEISESKDGDFITSIVHLITNINGNDVEIFLDLTDYISQDKADEILKDTLKTLNSKTTKSELESALTKAFKGSKIMKTEPDFGYTTYKKYIKESKDNTEVFYYEPAPSRTPDKPSFGTYIATEEKTFASINKEPMTITDFKKKMQLPFLAYAIEVYKKKNIKESKDDFNFSKEDVKTLKSLKFKINSDNDTATMDFFAGGKVARIIVITAAEFGAVDIKIVRNMKQTDTYYETKDVDLEEAKKYIPAVIEELKAFIEAEEDFDNIWNKI